MEKVKEERNFEFFIHVIIHIILYLPLCFYVIEKMSFVRKIKLDNFFVDCFI